MFDEFDSEAAPFREDEFDTSPFYYGGDDEYEEEYEDESPFETFEDEDDYYDPSDDYEDDYEEDCGGDFIVGIVYGN